MRSKPWLYVSLTLMSCAESPSSPQASAPDADAIVGWLSINGGGPLFTADAAGTHDRTVSCPLGGRMVQAWSTTIRTEGDVDHIAWTGSIKNEACALRVESTHITLDGSTQLEGESRIRRPAEPGQRSTLLYSRAHESGQIASQIGTRRQTCVLDLLRTFEPEQNAMRVRGIYCNSAIDIQLPRRD